jgi:hypothetical protein
MILCMTTEGPTAGLHASPPAQMLLSLAVRERVKGKATFPAYVGL